jgi:hypothetical protein
MMFMLVISYYSSSTMEIMCGSVGKAWHLYQGGELDSTGDLYERYALTTVSHFG